MRAELPVFRIFQSKPCVHKTHPILAYALNAHGCGWKFWFDMVSGSKFCTQPRFHMFKQATYPLSVSDQKKIDARPIFTVPDNMPNLALMSGTVKISAVSILLWPNTSCCYCALLVGIIADRPCNFGVELPTKLFFSAKICVRTFAFIVKFCMDK